MIDSILSYISNVRNHTHVLLTRVKKGEYANTSYKIPDALMMSVIDFVEIDCFHAAIGTRIFYKCTKCSRIKEQDIL